MDLSVVIPVFNEEENILPLYQKLRPVMEGLKLKNGYETIFVDDGSTDKTFSILQKISEEDKNLKVVKLKKRFGKTAALNAGFELVKGNVIITMDGDLQNDPSDIPSLLKKLDEGYDVVSGWRKERHDPFFSKKVPSKISNWLTAKLTSVKLHDFNCPLKAFKKECIKNMDLFGEMHRYIPAIAAFEGYSVAEIPVKHYPRKYGKTKYGIGRLFRGFLDLAYLTFWFKYSTRPFHFFGILGLLEILFGILVFLYKFIVEVLIWRGPFLFTTMFLLAVISIVSGIQLFMFGFLLEAQVRTYYKTKDTYKTDKVLNE